MISSIIYLSSPSETSTEQLAPVGAIRSHNHPTYGYQLYRMVKAPVTLAANGVVIYASGSSVNVIKAGAAAVNSSAMAGVTQGVIPAGSYGWVVCAGQCGIKAIAAAILINVPVATHGAGGFIDDATVTEGTTVGTTLAAIGSGAVGTVRLKAML